MRSYRPSAPFTVPAMLLIPELITAKGSTKKKYPESGDIIYCSFRTFGGTETINNGVYSVENTAKIETWYRPDIKADCRIRLESGTEYEIVGEPENINMRNQYMTFKVKATKGGA